MTIFIKCFFNKTSAIMALEEKNTTPDICVILAWASALFSVAGIAIAVLQQINDCPCSEQEQSPDSQGFV